MSGQSKVSDNSTRDKRTCNSSVCKAKHALGWHSTGKRLSRQFLMLLSLKVTCPCAHFVSTAGKKRSAPSTYCQKVREEELQDNSELKTNQYFWMQFAHLTVNKLPPLKKQNSFFNYLTLCF